MKNTDFFSQRNQEYINLLKDDSAVKEMAKTHGWMVLQKWAQQSIEQYKTALSEELERLVSRDSPDTRQNVLEYRMYIRALSNFITFPKYIGDKLQAQDLDAEPALEDSPSTPDLDRLEV